MTALDYEIELNHTPGIKKVLTFGAQPLFRQATQEEINSHHEHGHSRGLVEDHKLEGNDALKWWNSYKEGKVDFGPAQEYSTDIHVTKPVERPLVHIPDFVKYEAKEPHKIESVPLVLEPLRAIEIPALVEPIPYKRKEYVA